MPRNMSFALTTDQVRNRTKFVTRRFGWWFLEPGDIVNACVKCMGLKKGETVDKICQIRIVSTRPEPLFKVTKEECVLEGFPDYEPEDFIDMLRDHYKCSPEEVANRIEFEYL